MINHIFILAVRLEWCKALARKTRWTEEVLIVEEEMKRVLRFLGWKERWWKGRDAAASTLTGSLELASGLSGYAKRQAALSREMAKRFRKQWESPMRQRTSRALQSTRALA